MSGILVRDSRPEDLPQIAAIYAYEVLHGLATFEEIPPDTEEMGRRREAVRELGLPHLVATAERADRILGYAYAAAYRARPAYRNTVEDSVYVAETARGRGVGRALLAELVARCEEGWRRQMIAVIGNSANRGSIELHRSLGFEHVGTLKAVGFKHGQWVDTVYMQRPLGPGSTVPQSPPGAG
ncbi:GNAT family N-acetyltransferase [Tropicimonas sp. IMCC6043]|uniref:GNAT family N-acetyltransferase n=1 Tax=Tropicimonas sp. IMCC6043 TaxID=2510645 RepID=UPI00101B9CC5|nr:GNAT family N-acetyltransferase [Tropicimonas sp. IMCC6043]RYH08769.1 N-acetyltransferase family protein [Tropicimonas sp. IMCC6043]